MSVLDVNMFQFTFQLTKSYVGRLFSCTQSNHKPVIFISVLCQICPIKNRNWHTCVCFQYEQQQQFRCTSTCTFPLCNICRLAVLCVVGVVYGMLMSDIQLYSYRMASERRGAPCLLLLVVMQQRLLPIHGDYLLLALLEHVTKCLLCHQTTQPACSIVSIQCIHLSS